MFHHVLATKELLLEITSYQRGFPDEIVQLRRLLRPIKLFELLQLLQKHSPLYTEQCHLAFGPFHAKVAGREIEWERLQSRLLVQYYGLVYGVLSIVRSLNAMDCLAFEFTHWVVPAYFGHLNIIEFLYSVDREGYDTRAMRVASANGHLSIVRFLHEHGYPTDLLMHLACVGGHLDLAEYARKENLDRDVGATTINFTASNGYMNTLEFLHVHNYQGFSTATMDGASRNGHLHIVEFLHANRTEGHTEKAFLEAVRNGHLNIVRFFEQHEDEYVNIMEGCKIAAFMGHMQIVEYLVRHRKQQLDLAKIEECARKGKIASFSEQRRQGCQMIIEFIQQMVTLTMMEAQQRIKELTLQLHSSSDWTKRVKVIFSFSIMKFIFMV
ncbi:hypothetical protein THRCLA_08389 [Thraustotheca clavata]|uniref:Ankyrin repeat-containing domain n=1 Tax=Thraustotheca clavata TaxID=74557 RepID=A0A1V9Z6P6_9STRA|nr:hypothetical protein THRCLA_08389 [Thraustotheca clavata]